MGRKVRVQTVTSFEHNHMCISVGCSRKAIITAQSTQALRLSSIIIAEETGMSSFLLPCPIIALSGPSVVHERFGFSSRWWYCAEV